MIGLWFFLIFYLCIIGSNHDWAQIETMDRHLIVSVASSPAIHRQTMFLFSQMLNVASCSPSFPSCVFSTCWVQKMLYHHINSIHWWSLTFLIFADINAWGEKKAKSDFLIGWKLLIFLPLLFSISSRHLSVSNARFSFAHTQTIFFSAKCWMSLHFSPSLS